MSSYYSLEEGEITNEEQNQLVKLNDRRTALNSVGNKNRIGSGVIMATVSMTLEQRSEVRHITEVTNIGHGSGAGGSGEATGSTSTTMLMSRTSTHKVTTSSCPLGIGIEVVFSDSHTKFATKDAMSQGDGGTTQKKRRISMAKKTAELQAKDNKNKFSMLDVGPNEDNEIDDDEMVFVRGASPPRKVAPSTPEMLTYLCEKSKSNARGKNSYVRRLPNCRTNKRKPKKQSTTKRQKKVSGSSNSENQRVSMSPYSATSDGQEKMLELCKFFLDNECFRGKDCEYMHEEFPCKYYYLGLECEEIDADGNKTCKLFHGGPLGSNILNALRRHLLSAPTDVLGQKFCDNVLSQKSRDDLVCMMNAFQVKLKEQNANNKPKTKVVQKEKSVESLKILRQKLCFLTEQQIECLQDLKVQRPEDALNLTLWELNSIGINKGIHLEAILATVLNGQDVDMRKLLPQPCKSLAEFIDDVTGDVDEEDEEKPLVIDETTIEENEEEQLTSNNNPPDDPLELSLRLDEETIRNETNETEQKIQDLKNPKAPIEERKKEAFELLDKLNELEHRCMLMRNKTEIKENVGKPKKTYKPTQTKRLKQNNLNKLKKMKGCKTTKKHENAENNNDIVLNNKIQDQSKTEKNDKANMKTSDKSNFEVKAALEQLAQMKFEVSTVEGNKPVAAESTTQKPQIQIEKEAIIKIEKLEETKEVKNSTDEGKKMTLRSQRKSVTPSPVKLSPSVNKKAKIVLSSDIKVRRLKIPKKVVPLVSKETLKELQLKQKVSTMKSNVQQNECASEDSAEISSVQPNVQPQTTQYIDDWEDCIEQSRSMSEHALNMPKSPNIPTPTRLLKFDTTPSRDMDFNAHKQSKYNFKRSTCFQQHIENAETHNDLRQMIEKKKNIEKDQKIIRTFSLRNKNPFSNKREELPKSYNTSSVPFNRVKKETRQPNNDSEEDWDKDEADFNNSSNNNSSTTPNNKSNDNYSGSDSFSKDNTCTVAGVPDSPIDEDIKTNSLSACYKNSKAKQRFNFDMKVDESNYYDAGDTATSPILSPTLSPVVDEIASPTYPSISSLIDYKPAKEIDGHMSFPAMPYCLHEIKMPNIEVNKPESLDKLLRSNTVDPRILKYKEKGYLDSPATPALSYFSSQQMSQYDPRRRTGLQTSPFTMDTQIQKQNPNMLLYRYLQQSPWYQGLMSTMKMQISHSIAELVRALNNFQKERLIDPSSIFDVFKLDCAGELIEIMRNIGIFIDANGFITEDKSFGLYGGARNAFSSPAPITSTYSFMPQLLSQPTRAKPAGLLGYGQPGVSVAMPPQVAEASFVSCYVEAPTFSQFTQRRHNSFPTPANNATPPSMEDDEEESWSLPDDVSPLPLDENPMTYCNYKNNRNRQMNIGAGCGGGGGGGGAAGNSRAVAKRNDRPVMRHDNRRNGGSFNYGGYRY